MMYILVDKEVKQTDDIKEWGENFSNNRRVAMSHKDNLSVSTVFLGIDHNYFKKGPPLVFETMVFGGQQDYQERCATYEEAEKMHKRVCKLFGIET